MIPAELTPGMKVQFRGTNTKGFVVSSVYRHRNAWMGLCVEVQVSPSNAVTWRLSEIILPDEGDSR